MRKRKVITLILLGVFLAGLSLLLYPSVSSYWNSITQSRAIVDYDTIVKSLSPKDNTAYFERAEEYNSELKALSFPLTEYQQISGYDDCLNAVGDGVIGYIDIDKIQVKLPIYHGTDPSMLNHACGHIQGSSFPIAGKGTHAAISAHRGLPSAKLFSDLDKLEVYDKYAMFLHGNNGLSRVEGSGTGKILVIKDSYANSFVPYLTANYATIDVVDFRNYNYGLDQLIAANDYDQILVLYSYATV